MTVNYFAELDSDTQDELRGRLPVELLERAAQAVVDGIDLDIAHGYDSIVEATLWGPCL